MKEKCGSSKIFTATSAHIRNGQHWEFGSCLKLNVERNNWEMLLIKFESVVRDIGDKNKSDV